MTVAISLYKSLDERPHGMYNEPRWDQSPRGTTAMGNRPALKLVTYYRVSTDRQGRSGLGLEAQQATAAAYATAHAGVIVASYQEVETGKRNERPELAKAITHAKRIGGRLVIAKLDRLARNARFLLGLVESGVDLGFGDLPSVPSGPTGKFMLTQLAAVAELEAGLISERTKAALAALKARGVKLGASRPECRGRLSAEAAARGRERGVATVKAAAAELAADLAPIARELREQGMTLEAIASELNARGYVTRRGKPFTHVAVMRLLNRA